MPTLIYCTCLLSRACAGILYCRSSVIFWIGGNARHSLHLVAIRSLWAEFEYKVYSVAQNMYFLHWEHIEYKYDGNLCESLIESTKGCRKPVILFFAEIFWQIDQPLLGFSQSEMISRWLLVASTLYLHLQFRTKGAMLAALVVLVATF